MLFSIFCWISGSKDGKTAFLACGTRQVLAEEKKATSADRDTELCTGKGSVVVLGSQEMANDKLTFTQEVSKPMLGERSCLPGPQ